MDKRTLTNIDLKDGGHTDFLVHDYRFDIYRTISNILRLTIKAIRYIRTDEPILIIIKTLLFKTNHKTVLLVAKLLYESHLSCMPSCWLKSQRRTVIFGPTSSQLSTGSLTAPMTLWLPKKKQ